MKFRSPYCAFFCAAFFLPQTVFSAPADEEDWAKQYGAQSSVAIATGSDLPISRAPAVASVITADDIHAMAATNLEEVLQTIPGVHVTKLSEALYPAIIIRGIARKFNPQVLILVNGIRENNLFQGNLGQAHRAISLRNVERIEIIRGPGSALYGAEAYAGVINIITKKATHKSNSEYGLEVGSYDTQALWTRLENSIGPVEAAFYMRASRSEGYKGIVERDLQSTIDESAGTRVSLAPGPLNTQTRSTEFGMDLAYENWRLRTNYLREDSGMTALAGTIDPSSVVPMRYLTTNLSYSRSDLFKNWSLTALVGYDDNQEHPSNIPYQLFPPGVQFAQSTFPEGVLGNPAHSERHTYAHFDAAYSGLEKHRLRIGMGLRTEDMYEVTEQKNFNIVIVPGLGPTLVPLGGMVDVTHDPSMVFLPTNTRHQSFIFVQDEWAFANDWSLTTGVRHDSYSDVGGTTNPRLALVWNADYNVTIKALHGRAFRAPSHVEMYAFNNPVARGNPNLKPETIVTNELALSWQPSPTVNTNMNLFKYRMSDMIRFTPNDDPVTGFTARNTGRQSGHGAEFEVAWDASSSLRLSGNYSYQKSMDEPSNHDAGMAPHHKLFGQVNWKYSPEWSLNTVARFIGGRQREAGDPRPASRDYTLVDFTLRRERFLGNWTTSLSINNVFNQDAREPTFAPGHLYFDVPLPKRNFYFQIEHQM